MEKEKVLFFHGAYITHAHPPPLPTVQGFTNLSLISYSPHRVVYKGFQEKDGRQVVLKMPIFRLVARNSRIPYRSRLATFAEEYNILNILKDKGLANVITPQALIHREEDKTIVLVMDYFDGITLHEYISPKNPFRVSATEGMSLPLLLELAIGLTSTLAAVHEQSIVHKDVTSSNILYNPRSGEFRLIDFGLSAMFVEEQSRNATMEGTLFFLSTEQTGRVNKRIDYRTDLYSLGVVLYHLLTARLPFQGTNSMELIHAILAIQVRITHFTHHFQSQFVTMSSRSSDRSIT